MFKYCVLLFALGSLCYLVSADDVTTPAEAATTQKPPQIQKFCPAPTGFAAGPCRIACKDDSNCRGEQKCCPTKCGGATCATPVNTQPVVAEEDTSTISTKEGTCPGPYYTKDQCGTLNVATCVRDSQCLGTQKCCHNGCVMTCRRPEATKTGECPSGGTSVACNRKACIADSDCAANLKCCHDGCRCSLPNSRTNPVSAVLSGFQQRINSTIGAAAAALPSIG